MKCEMIKSVALSELRKHHPAVARAIEQWLDSEYEIEKYPHYVEYDYFVHMLYVFAVADINNFTDEEVAFIDAMTNVEGRPNVVDMLN